MVHFIRCLYRGLANPAARATRKTDRSMDRNSRLSDESAGPL